MYINKNIIVFLGIISVLLLALMRINNSAITESRKFISDCTAAGGEPVYDLCAEKGFKVIKLPGYDWADEVDDYNK